ncbi:MAG: S1/P1 nuclease [Thermoanaerobaculia bacterium]
MSELLTARHTVVLALATALLTPPMAHAWGDNGHRIVGQGADNTLSEDARHAVRAISGNRTLAMLATWPDFARSDKAWGFVSAWHYVTVEDDETLGVVLERSALTLEPDNVVEAIDYFARILDGDAERRQNFQELMNSNRAAPLGGSLDLTALSLLAHFIGDVHQPLHVGRGNDRGGNSIAVNFFGEVKKLHSVWDSAIIEHQRLSFSEFSRFLEAELGGQIDPGDGGPQSWAQESREYRHGLYEIWGRTSRDNYLPEIGYDYIFTHLGTIQRRLYLGGQRLGGLLNELFD